MNLQAYGAGTALFQIADLTTPLDNTAGALPNHTTFLEAGANNLLAVQAWGNIFAWDNASVHPAAATVTKSLVDAGGNPRQVTLLFYQANDIGTAAPPVNPNPPHQAAWAWYAFDTTGGKTTTTPNLLDGTGIIQGYSVEYYEDGPECLYDRDIPGNVYWGDFIYFNSDGSLASEGGVANVNWALIAYQTKAEIVLPPVGGWPFGVFTVPDATLIELNFGTAGLLGYGQRDGLTGDAAASSVH